MTNNFNKHIEFIEEKFGKELVKEISLLEQKIIEFSDGKFENIGQFSMIGSILSKLLNYIFETFLEGGDFSDFNKWSFNDKINFLFEESAINDQDIKHILHSLRVKRNIFAHFEQHKEEIEVKENFSKSTLIEIVHSIAIILQWLSSSKARVHFDSSLYYGNNKNVLTLSKKIKSNIYEVKERTIKIEDHQIVNIIYDNTITFNIPLYQRGYAWDKENIDDLFFDLKNRIIDQRFHFFGNITFIRMDANKNNSIIKIVDGQQRITTTILFLRAIFNKYKTLLKDDSKIDNNLLSFIEKHKDFPIERIDNSETMNVLNKIWNHINDFTTSEIDSKPYVAWKNINDRLKDKTLEEIDDIFSVLKRLTIGVNWIKGFDEFELFESLNSKGKSLETFDKLKNYIFSLISEEIEKDNEEEVVTIFHNLIESKFDILPKKKINAAKEMFILKYIEKIEGKKVNKNRLFPQFKSSLMKEYKNCNNLTIDKYKEILFELSKMISGTLMTQTSEPSVWTENVFLSPYFNAYKNLINATAYSSVLFSYVTNEKYFEYDREYGTIKSIKNRKEFNDILKILEVWKVRRDVSHNEGNETIGSHMPPFLKDVSKIKENFYEELKELIEKQDGFLIIPNIDKFIHDLENNPLSNKSVLTSIFTRVSEWYNNNELEVENSYSYYPIIESEYKKRSKYWESKVKELSKDPINTLNRIGNYFMHNKKPGMGKISETDFTDMKNMIDNNNITINLNEEFSDGPLGIDCFENLKLQGDYEEFVKKRSEYFAKIAGKIFVY